MNRSKLGLSIVFDPYRTFTNGHGPTRYFTQVRPTTKVERSVSLTQTFLSEPT